MFKNNPFNTKYVSSHVFHYIIIYKKKLNWGGGVGLIGSLLHLKCNNKFKGMVNLFFCKLDCVDGLQSNMLTVYCSGVQTCPASTPAQHILYVSLIRCTDPRLPGGHLGVDERTSSTAQPGKD